MSSPTQAQNQATTTTKEFDGAQWLDKALDTARVDRDDAAARKRGSDALDQFIAQAVKPGHVVSKDVETNVKYWIADPTGTPHILPGASATQWFWGPSYDISSAHQDFSS